MSGHRPDADRARWALWATWCTAALLAACQVHRPVLCATGVVALVAGLVWAVERTTRP